MTMYTSTALARVVASCESRGLKPVVTRTQARPKLWFFFETDIVEYLSATDARRVESIFGISGSTSKRR
jgi:hypothetical protein